MRHHTFFSLAELNQAIRRLLDDLNRRPMRGWGKSRRELFLDLEQLALQPLPDSPYDPATVLARATVGIDYHIEFDGNFYSVPYRLIRQRVMVRATERTVEVFRKGFRVASHLRIVPKRRHHQTNPEHRPPTHKAYLEWTPERFLHWAEKIGHATQQLIQKRLQSARHPEQAFRACLGILGLAKRYGDKRLEAACQRAIHYDITSYRGIKNILQSDYDRLPISGQSDQQQSCPSHTNVRGATYYH